MSRYLVRRLAKIEGDRPGTRIISDEERRKRLRELIDKVSPLSCTGPLGTAVANQLGLNNPVTPDAFRILSGRQQLAIMRARAEDRHGESWRRGLGL